jgi:large conductance mechanosensitive channel
MPKKRIKSFFAEFKKFITRGNVLDMSVGVIVGGAFTGIVNGMSNFILKPLTNWLLALLLGKDALSDVYTMLKEVVDPETGLVILEQSIYIDWGAFINSVINFFLIAFVLFAIVKAMNSFIEAREKFEHDLELEVNEKKEIRKYRKAGLSRKQAIAKYEEEKLRIAQEKAEAERVAAELAAADAAAKAKADEEKATANTRLLEEIRDLLKQNAQK